MTVKSQKIAGLDIELTNGVQYYASRPMASRERKIYPIAIKEVGTGITVKMIDGLSFNEANEFLMAFNTATFSWQGRVW